MISVDDYHLEQSRRVEPKYNESGDARPSGFATSESTVLELELKMAFTENHRHLVEELVQALNRITRASQSLSGEVAEERPLTRDPERLADLILGAARDWARGAMDDAGFRRCLLQAATPLPKEEL